MNVAVEELWPSRCSRSPLKELARAFLLLILSWQWLHNTLATLLCLSFKILIYEFSHPVSQDKELQGVNPFHPGFKPLQMHENSKPTLLVLGLLQYQETL